MHRVRLIPLSSDDIHSAAYLPPTPSPDSAPLPPTVVFLNHVRAALHGCMGLRRTVRMLYFSGIVSGAAAVTYLLDTHGPNALHILSLTDSAKSFVLYSMVFFANGLVLRGGVKRTLLVLGACQAVCCLAAVPMYVYGKRVRAFVSALPFCLFCR